MKSLNKIFYKILAITLLTVMTLSYGIPGILSPLMVFAADVTDYDFTDELDADRVGIGFEWKASTKTLTITEIKNRNAIVQLPQDSTIDIQGNIENIMRAIICAGNLTIKGNEIASIKIPNNRVIDSNSTTGVVTYETINVSGDLTFESGNLSIGLEDTSRIGAKLCRAKAIKATNFIMNGGNITLNVPMYNYNRVNGSTQYMPGYICAIAATSTINDGNLDIITSGNGMTNTTINGGNVKITTTDASDGTDRCIDKQLTLNGGNIELSAKGDDKVLSEVPNINPLYKWSILYNETSELAENAEEASISDIYNIYSSKYMKISLREPTTSIDIVSPKETIEVGEQTTFQAVVNPENTTDITTWSSSNEEIATVSQKGEVLGISPGIAIIKAQSGECLAEKGINVKSKITLDPNGIEGIELQELYTDTNGKLTELPSLPNVGNLYFEKWVDSNGNEVTLDTIYKENTTIYAQWVTREISVGEQKTSLQYGEAGSTIYEVTSNFAGTHTVAIENLPTGITLEDTQINFIETEEGTYQATIKLNVLNTIQAGVIQNLKVVVNDTIISNNFTLTIEKAVANYESPTAKTIVYTGNAQELVAPGSTTDGQMQYSLDGRDFTRQIPTATNAGTYTVYYKVIGDKNHQDSSINHITAIINKANSYIETAPKGNYFLSYNGQEQELVQAGTAVGGTIEYSLDGENFKAEIPKAQNVGDYVIYYRVRGDANHNSTTKVQEEYATIYKVEATIEVLPTSKDLIYNGEKQELINPGITNDGVMEYAIWGVNYSTEIPTATDIGEYPVYYRVLGDDNHSYSATGCITTTIKPKKAEVELENKSLQYNGQEQELVSLVRVEGVYSIHYSLDGSLYIDDTIPTATDTGIYTIYYTATGAPNYEDTEVKTITSIINPAESKFTKLPEAMTLVYTGDTYELIMAGKTDDGVIEYSLDGKEFSTNIPMAESSGNYTVYYRIVGDRNHTNTSIQQLQVTIQKAKIEINELPKANSLIYANGQEQELVKQGAIWGGDFVYSLDHRNYSKEIPKAAEPGNYKIYYKIVAWEDREDIEGEFYIEVTIEENPNTKPKELPFTDVSNGSWYYSAVEYCYKNNIIRGLNDTTFSPNTNLTRGMLVTILNRMEGSPKAKGTSRFADVQDSSKYYYNSVVWATENKIVSGYDNGKFGPDDPITREQLAIMLNKYCRYKGKYKEVNGDLSKFKDANKIASYAISQMKWAVGTGVITGNSTTKTLNPKGNATRAEVASMLYKYCTRVK